MLLKEQVNNGATEKNVGAQFEELFVGVYKRLDSIIEVLGRMVEQKEAGNLAIKPSCSTPIQPRQAGKVVCIAPCNNQLSCMQLLNV